MQSKDDQEKNKTWENNLLSTLDYQKKKKGKEERKDRKRRKKGRQKQKQKSNTE